MTLKGAVRRLRPNNNWIPRDTNSKAPYGSIGEQHGFSTGFGSINSARVRLGSYRLSCHFPSRPRMGPAPWRVVMHLLIGHGMSEAPLDRAALEDRWRDRVKTASARLRFARNYTKEVEADRCSGLLPSVDGNFAYQRAISAETEALAEYARVLRIFTSLIVRGEVPGDKGESKPGSARPPECSGKPE